VGGKDDIAANVGAVAVVGIGGCGVEGVGYRSTCAAAGCGEISGVSIFIAGIGCGARIGNGCVGAVNVDAVGCGIGAVFGDISVGAEDCLVGAGYD